MIRILRSLLVASLPFGGASPMRRGLLRDVTLTPLDLSFHLGASAREAAEFRDLHR